MYHGAMNMMQLTMVALGGALGSVARYAISIKLGVWGGLTAFPFGTVVVNTLGCLLIGGLFGGAVLKGWLTPELRLFLVVGVLGGFTTFSTFAIESIELARNGAWGLALLNILLQNMLGLLAALVGFVLVSRSA